MSAVPERTVRVEVISSFLHLPVHTLLVIVDKMSDRITISQLSIHLANGLGSSAFGLEPPPPCPILLDVVIHLKRQIIPLVANHDSMASLGVNYSSVSKHIYARLSSREQVFTRPEEVLDVTAGCVLALDSVDRVEIALSLPRAALHAESVRYRATYDCQGCVADQGVEIRDMKVACVVGLHPHERQERQRLEVDLDLAVGGLQGWKGLNHKAIHDMLHHVRTLSLACLLPHPPCSPRR